MTKTDRTIPLDAIDAWCCEPRTTVDIEVVRSVLRDMERYQREASDELSARFANLAHIIARLEQDDAQRLSNRRVVDDAALKS